MQTASLRNNQEGGANMAINPVGQGSTAAQAAKTVPDVSTNVSGVHKKGHRHHHGGHHNVGTDPTGQAVDTAQISSAAKDLSLLTGGSASNTSTP